MDKRLLEIYTEIDALILDLLGPLRISKSINRNTFEKFYTLLGELAEIIKSDGSIPVKLAGKLFFIYMSMNGEASHTKYPDPLFLEIGILESHLDKVFRH